MKKFFILLFVLGFLVQSSYSQWQVCKTLFDGEDISGYAKSDIYNYVSNILLEVYLSTDDGVSWTKQNSSLDVMVEALAANGNVVFAGTNNNGIYVSTDYGVSWTQKNSGLTNNSVKSIAVSNNNVYAGTEGGGIFLSTNNGDSWTAKNQGLNSSSWVNKVFTNGTDVWVGNWDGIYLSTNNGTTWAEKNTGVSYIGGYDFAMSGNDIFAATSEGVFLSTNNGISWNVKNSGLKNIFVEHIKISGNKIFTSSQDSGVFLSTNYGDSWTQVNSGLTDTHIFGLEIIGNYIYAQTGDLMYSNYRAMLSDFNNNDVLENIKNDNQITIFPNPASDKLIVTANNNNQTNKIEIINLFGVKIMEYYLIDKSLSINVESLSKGVYFLRIGNDTKMFVKE